MSARVLPNLYRPRVPEQVRQYLEAGKGGECLLGLSRPEADNPKPYYRAWLNRRQSIYFGPF